MFLAEVSLIGIGDLIERIRTLNQQYGEVISKSDPSPTYDEWRAVYEAGHQALVRLVAGILGTCRDETPSDVARRTELLTPLWEQEQAAARYARTRRRNSHAEPEAEPTEEIPIEEASVDAQ